LALYRGCSDWQLVSHRCLGRNRGSWGNLWIGHRLLREGQMDGNWTGVDSNLHMHGCYWYYLGTIGLDRDQNQVERGCQLEAKTLDVNS